MCQVCRIFENDILKMRILSVCGSCVSWWLRIRVSNTSVYVTFIDLRVKVFGYLFLLTLLHLQVRALSGESSTFTRSISVAAGGMSSESFALVSGVKCYV